ncbi:Crp/Fnr family transcriptional regulator [Brevibacillus porteri]|uniref:Crp/Fnr family transcriptional regulator n=1 Tax=Brevibacillus porteri TaxID=2126350 RepID=A0ABX5FTB6_9BACL|nr:Crp/Fnr family transcriptional regulator [Brevibacillus porteri]MED1797360.1 Crp/Fnr family transcriptional regulator [Brevibacillus porteri]MED2129430.1 Crp/Fnr family transcriptional regulator [Brevibacillus porteri]MED2747647.1 Crp/Fnr family transcriptional regulator [Brevibacillus porteri]MED2815662.1 Crp/Fnr family transcriptional regulator [Brevibacillus porteri]MED2896775.1 Crp/Fnr family transcriptional regulator [Brevibacillus porteri]
MQKEQIAEVLARFPSLAALTLEEWQEEGISITTVPANFTIDEGEFLENAPLILDGLVRIFKLSSDGREVTLYRLSTGECCPLIASSILGETVYEASACVEKPSMVLNVPTKIYKKWIEKHQGFRQYIFQSFARRLIIMSNLIDDIHFKSIRVRISEYLIEHTSAEDDSLAITHDQLAIELGTAREVISRTLKKMEKEGLLRVARGQITDIQRSRLPAVQ